MRLVTLAICIPAILAGQSARDVLRRSMETDRTSSEAVRNYTYIERQEETELDGSGKIKSRDAHTYDVTLQEGSPYRRLMAHNDQPLPPKEQKKEEEKLRKSIEDRSKETAGQKQRRIDDWHRKQEKQREPVREVPDAFDLRLLGEEALAGRPVYVIDGMPRAGYKARSKVAASILPKLKVKFWVDKRDYQCVRAEFETLATIAWGGIVARLAKGDRFSFELARVNDEVWLPKHVSLTGSARILLVKAFHGGIDITYSDYKKFSAESRILPVGQ